MHRKYAIYIMITIGAVLMSTAPFWHIEFRKESLDVEKHRKKTLDSRVDRNKARALLIENLKEYSKKNPDTELAQLSLDYIKHKNIAAKNNNILSELRIKDKFLGFHSTRYFVYAIGVPLSLFFLSIILILASSYLKRLDRYLSLSIFICGLVNLFTSLFFINWSLFKEVDYKLTIYHTSIIGISLLVIISSILFYFFQKTLLEKLKLTVDFILKTRNSYFKRVASKAILIEKIEDEMEIRVSEVSKDITEFDQDLWETLDKVAK